MAQSSFLSVKFDPAATHTFVPEARPQAQRGAVLVIVQEGERREIDLPASGRVVLGRAPECEVSIQHATLSRHHVAIELGEVITVQDLGSKNGTRFRKGRLPPRRAVEPAIGSERIPGEIFEPGGLVCYLKRPAMEVSTTAAGLTAAAPVLVDSAMLRIYALLERVASGELPVLLLGETGVGKEVAAKWVHARSSREHAPFLALNCAAFSPSLLESELFGHEKGAFTGAHTTKVGLLEAADRGTLFLDEVGEMPAGVQAAFLRVLEERAVLRVGATRARAIDVRIVAATNRSLEAEVAAGRFRKDLFFRLNGISVELPPLRERPSEILPLARALLQQRARSPGGFTARAESAMVAYAWPGNVRELRNVVERAALLAGNAREPIEIDVEHLGLPSDPPLDAALSPRSSEPPRSSRQPTPSSGALAAASASPRALREQLESLERARIVQALEAHGGNQTRAAAALGMPRRTFVARLDAYGIARPRRR